MGSAAPGRSFPLVSSGAPHQVLHGLGAREVGEDAEGMGLACPRPRLPVSRVLHQPLLAEQLSIPLQGTVSEQVCPEGPGVLLREALGAKVDCLGGGGGMWGSMVRGQGLLVFPLRGLSPAETKAEALPTGMDLVLGFYVYEAPCILTISTQHPVSPGHAGLRSFTSRTE